MTAVARPSGPLRDTRLMAALANAMRQDTWTIALVLLLVALLVLTRLINPNYGPFNVTSLAMAALPVALAAVAQAIAVISGGIDLSIGSVMALTSVTAATLFVGASPELSVGIVLAILLMGVVIGLINGSLIVLTRVPDIVVTLAMLFVWGGAALLVLNRPGGAVTPWLRELMTGSLLIDWLPRALVLLLTVVGLVWIPLRRSTLGLSIYAIGSNRLAAFRSGVNVGRTRIAAYAFTGLFAAAGGLALTAATGIGSPIPGPYLLLSVAAVVLGGVSLAGGQGGLLGPIIAVFILALIRADLTFLGVNPNYAEVIQGAIMVLVVMFGAYVTLRRRRRA
ncbi:MAG TPA: ABC transporter permease [Candidatus Limnocylindria bacterium]|nr:ABC transporter permease [Candidatus Limnocylindria bacterium]